MTTENPFPLIIHNPNFAFANAISGRQSCCRLDIYGAGRSYLVVATELRHNPGFSITNAPVELAQEIIRLYSFLDPTETMLVEHYSDTESYGKPRKWHSFSRVAFEECSGDQIFQAPRWKFIVAGDNGDVLFDHLNETFSLFYDPEILHAPSPPPS